MKQSTIESLVHIRREDLSVEEDTDFIIKDLCVEIMHLKEIIDTQKEIIEDLEESDEE